MAKKPTSKQVDEARTEIVRRFVNKHAAKLNPDHTHVPAESEDIRAKSTLELVALSGMVA